MMQIRILYSLPSFIFCAKISKQKILKVFRQDRPKNFPVPAMVTVIQRRRKRFRDRNAARTCFRFSVSPAAIRKPLPGKSREPRYFNGFIHSIIVFRQKPDNCVYIAIKRMDGNHPFRFTVHIQ